MPEQLSEAERQRLEQRLFELKQEHRDLDDVISRLLLSQSVLRIGRFDRTPLAHCAGVLVTHTATE